MKSKSALYIRIALILFVPLVVILAELKEKYFNHTGDWVAVIFAVLIPAGLFYLLYLHVSNYKCSKCGGRYFSKNVSKMVFGDNRVCVNCKQ